MSERYQRYTPRHCCIPVCLVYSWDTSCGRFRADANISCDVAITSRYISNMGLFSQRVARAQGNAKRQYLWSDNFVLKAVYSLALSHWSHCQYMYFIARSSQHLHFNIELRLLGSKTGRCPVTSHQLSLGWPSHIGWPLSVRRSQDQSSYSTNFQLKTDRSEQ